jgi:hypothetical protein
MGFGKKRSSKVGVGAITTDQKKLFAEGGMMDDGKGVDPVSGNDVPVGSLAEEVRDDVDAKLSPGEFVIPADVVRFIGLERLMKMRDEAKKGLARMNDIGQMGNAEEVGEASNEAFTGEEEDDDFESEIDGIMKEVDSEETERQTEMAFNAGGFVNPSYYDITKAPKNPALDIRYFNDAEGKTFYMPFINGKPMKPMPNNATQTGMPTGTSSTTNNNTSGNTGVKVGGGQVVDTNTLLTGGGTSDINTVVTTDKTKDTDKTTDGTGLGVAGTYDGSNIKDFGRSDLIYNPGGSGAGGEIVGDDLYGGLNKFETQLGSAVVTGLAAAMGVPGILTSGVRWAVNKYGQNAVNEYLGRLNQEMVGRAGGLDVSTTEGRAGAMSQIDQLGQLPGNGGNFAATAGATGTGGRAADVGSYVYEQLKDTGLSDSQIAAASQEAVNAVIGGKSMNDAVSETVAKYDPAAGSFGVRLSDMDSAPESDFGSSFGVLTSDMDFDTGVTGNFGGNASDIGFDWSMMGDFGSSGGGNFKEDTANVKPAASSSGRQENSYYDDSYRTQTLLEQTEEMLKRKQNSRQ